MVDQIKDLYGPVIQTIRNRRVTRSFTLEDVPNEYILTLLESARFAPTGGGRRVIEYIVYKKQRKYPKNQICISRNIKFSKFNHINVDQSQ